MAEHDNPAGFLVEDFITSVTTQLDRVQDALRIKAVNRPLTYALKELHLELKVFVDMDRSGQVMLRAAGPNESGASTLAMDFTTITKPMIEENTISLAATRSTPLENLGLQPEEQMRLERLGVTNLAQLDRLRGSTGVNTVARMAEVPVDRLRRALQAGVPRLNGASAPGRVAPPRTPSPPARPAPAAPSRPQPARPAPGGATPATPAAKPVPGGSPQVVVASPAPSRPARPLPTRGVPRHAQPSPATRPPRARPLVPRPMEEDYSELIEEATSFATPAEPTYAQTLEVHPASQQLVFHGTNLQHEDYPPQITLNGAALAIDEIDDDRVVVRLPEDFEQGTLEVALGEQPPQLFTLVHPALEDDFQPDPWAPMP